jgi:SNF2 family DNA or RNA helicase
MEEIVELLQKWQPEAIVFDEAHRLKDYRRTAVRAQAAFKLANPGTKTKPLPRPLVYLLTGTPYPNSLLDIFMPYRIMDGGKTFGSTMIGFREKYFRDKNANMPKDKYFPKWVPLQGAKEELGRKMKDTSVRVEIDSCMDLPPVVQKTIAVEMDPEQRRIYQDMLREFVAVFERGGEQKESVATMAMTKGLRLMQIASGYVKDAEGQEHSATANDWTPKQEALKQILEDWTPGHKVIVWAVWKHNYEQIREVCRRLKIEWLEMNGEQGAAKNRENAKTFEASEQYRVIIGHPESGGEGINLVSSPCRVSYSRNFSWRQMKQSDARNRRGGSERHASITRINLVTKGTVEEKITEKLANHEEITETVLREITMNVEKETT